ARRARADDRRRHLRSADGVQRGHECRGGGLWRAATGATAAVLAASGNHGFRRAARLAAAGRAAALTWGDVMAGEWKAPEEKGEDKSWKLLEKAVQAGVREQRRARRWGIFFKLLTFAYLFGALMLF